MNKYEWEDAFRLLLATVRMAETTPKIIGRTHINGLMVSTTNTVDYGYETALVDEHAYPVERYTSLQEAEEGHVKWVQFCAEYHGQEVTMLGWGKIIPNEQVVLVPKNFQQPLEQQEKGHIDERESRNCPGGDPGQEEGTADQDPGQAA